MTVLRLTQEVNQVLYAMSPNLRLTQEAAQVLYTMTPSLRMTQEVMQALYQPDAPAVRLTAQYVEVLYTIDTSPVIALNTTISTTGTVAADLLPPKFKAAIQATGTLQGQITGTWHLTANINASASVSANLTEKTFLSAAITASGNVSANLRENIEYLTASIDATGDIIDADLTWPWHPGNTLQLRQTVDADIVLSLSASNILNLSHTLNLIFGARNKSATNALVFVQDVEVIRVLPTESADNTLVLSQSLSEYRSPENYLNLHQTVTGVIYYIDADAESVLNLTATVSAAGTVFNLDVTNQLNLTHSVQDDLVANVSGSNELDFWQNAFCLTLKTKTYVLLQAPFNFIQTTVVLPNPLMDDTENLISNLIMHRSMNGTRRTYVKSSNNRVLKYTFTLDRLKGLELEEFFWAYNGADIKLTNWKGEVWNVKLITNPVDFVQTKRAEPGGDRTEVNLQFEGKRIYG